MYLFNTFKKLFSVEETVLNTSEKVTPKKENNSQPKKPFSPQRQTFPKTDYEKKDKNTCYALFAKDGDSFEGMYNGEKLSFRLAGINAPERNQPLHKEAGIFLNSLIKKKVVYLEVLGEEPHNRKIVEVYLDKEKKEHVNTMLLTEGLATSERYRDNQKKLTHSTLEYVRNEFNEFRGKLKR